MENKHIHKNNIQLQYNFIKMVLITLIPGLMNSFQN